jgi:hypothetical protein
MEKILENIDVRIDGNKLIMTVDVTKNGVASKTGKTKLIASTRGAIAVDHPKVKGIKVAVNVMVPM